MQKKDSKNTQFPPPTGPYAVDVLGGAWRGHSVARLQISVSHPKHTGDKFYALAEWAAARFDKVELIVSDTLQRHNIALQHGISLEDAHDVATFSGRAWLRDNAGAISAIPAHKCVVTTWDSWLQHPDYAPLRAALDVLFEGDAHFRAAVEKKAQEFCKRQASGGNDLYDGDGAYEASVRYIMEELPAFGVMMKNESALDVYPGSWMEEIFEAISASGMPGLDVYGAANQLTVDYKKNKGFAAQRSPEAASPAVHSLKK